MVAECRPQCLSGSGFLLTTEEGERIAVDPYMTGNPRPLSVRENSPDGSGHRQ